MVENYAFKNQLFVLFYLNLIILFICDLLFVPIVGHYMTCVVRQLPVQWALQCREGCL